MFRTMGSDFSKNFALLCLTILFLPINTTVVVFALLYNLLSNGSQGIIQKHGNPDFKQKTILVTGIGMAKGLCTARLLHFQGHRVIGADCNWHSIGRVSRAFDKFFILPKPALFDGSEESFRSDYVLRLLEICKLENVDLWISASDVSAALQDAHARDVIEAYTNTRALQLQRHEVSILHCKSNFMNHIRSLGLNCPDTQTIRSKAALLDFLERRTGLVSKNGKPRYLLKCVDTNDAARFNTPLLPQASAAQTLRCIESITFPDGQAAYIAQEFIEGKEYCTHALVVRGVVRAFVACPSSSVLMHYVALSKDSALSNRMLEFTEAVAQESGENFTGHVSFDFLVKDSECDREHPNIYPIECNPRMHTAVVLFNNTPELTEQYLSVLDGEQKSTTSVLFPNSPLRYYWIGQDLLDTLILPLFALMRQKRLSFTELQEPILKFMQHVTSWKEGTFEIWDPLPWWWMYHVHWPLVFIRFLFNGRWQQVNVSTGKVFRG